MNTLVKFKREAPQGNYQCLKCLNDTILVTNHIEETRTLITFKCLTCGNTHTFILPQLKEDLDE